jgi:hypothetical protein
MTSSRSWGDDHVGAALLVRAVVAGHGPLVEHPTEVLGGRRGRMGDSWRTHGGLIDHRTTEVEPPATATPRPDPRSAP